MNLGLPFCPVVVVQSCLPGWACHSRGHRAHHNTVLEGAVKVQADNELAEMGSQNSDAVESCWLLETQLLRPQMNPEMVSPWEKEWRSGRCTLLSLYFFLFIYSWALKLPLFSYYSFPHFSKHCQTHKDRKRELPFEVAGLFQQHALAVRGGKKREKTVSNPEMFPDACFWQGKQ